MAVGVPCTAAYHGNRWIYGVQKSLGRGRCTSMMTQDENIALQKQQKELEEERDRLEKEVARSGDREYVQDQARRQLKLLNPGELLFTFEDEE